MPPWGSVAGLVPGRNVLWIRASFPWGWHRGFTQRESKQLTSLPTGSRSEREAWQPLVGVSLSFTPVISRPSSPPLEACLTSSTIKAKFRKWHVCIWLFCGSLCPPPSHSMAPITSCPLLGTSEMAMVQLCLLPCCGLQEGRAAWCHKCSLKYKTTWCSVINTYLGKWFPGGSGRSPGEGNGNPFQYSCLEHPMDGGAWWATVHGVLKSWTRLSDFTSPL